MTKRALLTRGITAATLRAWKTPAKTPAALLTRALLLLASKKRWVTGSYAATERGYGTDVDAPQAAKFCLLGAMYRVKDGTPMVISDRALFLLNCAINDHNPEDCGGRPWLTSIAEFNDRRAKHADIKRVLAKAVALAKKEGR